MAQFSMTREEREAFLADTHVAVVSIAEPGRGPLAVPVWYGYEPGRDVRIVTAPSSRKAKLLRAAGRASLCAQTETPPYRYVMVEGPVSFADVDYERDVRQIALRYLGSEMGEMYLTATAGERERDGMVLVRLRPERWYTVDYGKYSF